MWFMTLTVDREQQLDELFAALANGTRRAIIERLTEGAATVTELAEPFSMSLPAISKHLTVLERAGLIRRERDAQFRRCSLEPAVLRVTADWVDHQQQTWHAAFDRLERLLEVDRSRPSDPPPEGPRS